MTKDVEEGNKLLAKFMGYNYYPHPEPFPGWRITTPEIQKILPKSRKFMGAFLCRTTKELRYHYDWNWLMRVVEKVEKIEDEEYGRFAVYISSNHCQIQSTKSEKGYPKYLGEEYAEDKIWATFSQMVNFIRGYNEIKGGTIL